MSYTLCVFTPTYNRAYILPKLYRSLLKQDCTDFCWMVVDDGSTDNTDRIVQDYISENKIPIQLIRIANGGKQRAWNIGVDNCDAELFMCIDSDDYLEDGAIAQLLQVWNYAKCDHNNVGVVTPQFPKNNLFPDRISLSFKDLYRKYGYRGETCFATKTAVLKHYPFLVAEGEKFIPEVFVFDQIDCKFKHFSFNEEICLGEYLSDGYTSRYEQLLLKNPKSYAAYKRQCIDLADSELMRLKETMLFLSWTFIAKADIRESIENLDRRAEAALLVLPSFVLAQLTKRRFKDKHC